MPGGLESRMRRAICSIRCLARTRGSTTDQTGLLPLALWLVVMRGRIPWLRRAPHANGGYGGGGRAGGFLGGGGAGAGQEGAFFWRGARRGGLPRGGLAIGGAPRGATSRTHRGPA